MDVIGEESNSRMAMKEFGTDMVGDRDIMVMSENKVNMGGDG